MRILQQSNATLRAHFAFPGQNLGTRRCCFWIVRLLVVLPFFIASVFLSSSAFTKTEGGRKRDKKRYVQKRYLIQYSASRPPPPNQTKSRCGGLRRGGSRSWHDVTQRQHSDAADEPLALLALASGLLALDGANHVLAPAAEAPVPEATAQASDAPAGRFAVGQTGGIKKGEGGVVNQLRAGGGGECAVGTLGLERRLSCEYESGRRALYGEGSSSLLVTSRWLRSIPWASASTT